MKSAWMFLSVVVILWCACTVCQSDSQAGSPSNVGQNQQATLTKIYNSGDVAIEAGFIPDESQIILGQPLFITFTVVNKADKPYRFFVGGDNRGSIRHNNFRITAVDENGQAVKDPYSYNNFGGPGNNINLEPGQTYNERLYLGHWCAFENPGLCMVTCKRKLLDYGGEPRYPAVPIETNFKLEITPFSQEKMREIIGKLGKKLRDGKEQEVYEATLGLASIHDEQIIPHLAVSLTKGDFQNKLPAINGLSQFSSNAAADSLFSALKDADHVVRDASGGALRKMKKTARVLPTLLKELKHASPSVRALAACALGATKDKRTFSPLIATMEDPEPTVQHAAAIALGPLGYKEAIQPLIQHLKDDDMGMRVAVVKGLRLLGEFKVEWLTPVIKANTDINDQSFHEAIRLIRLYGGKDAARALVSCLKFVDPSPRNTYNMFLILAIEHSPNGPKYYYQFQSNPNTDGTPEQSQQPLLIFNDSKEPYKSEGACLKWIRQVPG